MYVEFFDFLFPIKKKDMEKLDFIAGSCIRDNSALS